MKHPNHFVLSHKLCISFFARWRQRLDFHAAAIQCLYRVCSSILLFLVAHAATAQAWHVTDLGTLGGDYSAATGINGSGEIVGAARTGNGETHAFVYSLGAMHDLGTLGNGYSSASAINDNGLIVGATGTVEADGSYHACLFTGGSIVDLGTLGGPYSTANDINNNGQIVGSSFTIAGGDQPHAFLYDSSGMHDLGTLGGQFSVAYGINDAGQIVGASTIADGRMRPFLYENGIMRDLGGLGGDYAVALAISESGVIVGSSNFNPPGGASDYHAFAYQNETMTDLGTLATDLYSDAYGVNTAGQIVGRSHGGSGPVRIFFYDDTGMHLILDNAIEAHAINDAGQVVGGTIVASGQTHAFLAERGPQLAGVAFAVGTVSGRKGTEILLPVLVTNFTDITSFQFSLQWDPTFAEFVTVEPGLPTLSMDNFGVLPEGTLTVSWDDPSLDGVTLADGAVVFSLWFRLIGDDCTATLVIFTAGPTALEASAIVDGQPQLVPLSTMDGEAAIVCELQIGGSLALCPGGTLVPDVLVTLSGDESQTVTTVCDGAYDLSVLAGGDYTVTPSKETLGSQGVSTADIVLIRRHILALAPLDQACQLIAADVDGSEAVSTFDIVLIRSCIIALTDSFPAGSWAFLPSDWVPANSLSPWPYPSSRTYSDLSDNVAGQDFVAIRLGDVNGSWQDLEACPAGGGGGMPGTAASDLPTVTFAASHESVPSGSPVSVAITVADFEDVTSVQFALQWDPAELEFVSVGDFALPGLSRGNFNRRLVADGKLPLSWDDPSGTGVTIEDGRTIFTIQFKALGACCDPSPVSLTDLPTAREVTVKAAVAKFQSHDGQVLFPPQFEQVEWFPDGSARLTLAGTVTEGEVEIQASTSLLSDDWVVVLQTNLTSRLVWIDPAGGSFSQRFYRVKWVMQE